MDEIKRLQQLAGILTEIKVYKRWSRVFTPEQLLIKKEELKNSYLKDKISDEEANKKVNDWENTYNKIKNHPYNQGKTDWLYI